MAAVDKNDYSNLMMHDDEDPYLYGGGEYEPTHGGCCN
jgi:hypothetical protein